MAYRAVTRRQFDFVMALADAAIARPTTKVAQDWSMNYIVTYIRTTSTNSNLDVTSNIRVRMIHLHSYIGMFLSARLSAFGCEPLL